MFREMLVLAALAFPAAAQAQARPTVPRAQRTGAPAAADPGTVLGGQIADMCMVGTGAQSIMCSAFLRGTYEGLTFGQISATGRTVSFCVPAGGMSLDDLRDTFLDYLDDEPDRRGEEAGMLLLASLQDRYPCDDAGDDSPTLEDPDALTAPDRVALHKSRKWKPALH